jgi:hypothetical protein
VAKHEVPDNKIGSYAEKLTAATVDEVVFADTLKAVEVWKDESVKLYYTVDGSTPTVGGSNTHEMPARESVRTVLVPSSSPRVATVVKLISAGTPEYSVARAEVGS